MNKCMWLWLPLCVTVCALFFQTWRLERMRVFADACSYAKVVPGEPLEFGGVP